jgi:hypothetical protein
MHHVSCLRAVALRDRVHCTLAVPADHVHVRVVLALAILDYHSDLRRPVSAVSGADDDTISQF